jgi:hypothetical protein
MLKNISLSLPGPAPFAAPRNLFALLHLVPWKLIPTFGQDYAKASFSAPD